MRLTLRGRAGALVAGVAAVGLAVGALHGREARSPQRPAARPAPAEQQAPAPRLSVVGLSGGVLRPGRPVSVAVLDGRLGTISVTDAAGVALRGRLGGSGTEWTSTAVAVPDTRYRVTATLLDAKRRAHRTTVQVTTGAASHYARISVAPLAGRTMGVGQPVIVWFDRPVTDKAAAERGLQVQMSQPVTGAWHWFGDREVHFRPRSYWPAGERVTLHVRLRGVELAPGVWGKDRAVGFSIGDAHVSTVDVTAHTMTVTSNGTVLRTLKVSTGRDKYPTLGGVHVVLAKQPKKIMDSATVGIPKGDPDYYYETVFWDVRISDGGAFVHAAPWSVGDQGRRNVSHGCVNLSVPDAQWFYGLARPGDIVTVIHAEVPPNLADPGMQDWNLSWARWVAGSALGH